MCRGGGDAASDRAEEENREAHRTRAEGDSGGGEPGGPRPRWGSAAARRLGVTSEGLFFPFI